MLKLSDRLEKICNGVEPGEIAADIGTDHGLLPLALFERGISPYMILTDVRQGPLGKVRNNLDRYFQHCESRRKHVIIDRSSEREHSERVDNMANTPQSTILNSEIEKGIVYFDIRLGSGLEILDYAEADTAVMAGMGGLLIIELLSKDQSKTRSIKKLILQPRVAADKLRRWLSENGYTISRDELAMECGKINEIITIRNPGSSSTRTLRPSAENKSLYIGGSNVKGGDNTDCRGGVVGCSRPGIESNGDYGHDADFRNSFGRGSFINTNDSNDARESSVYTEVNTDYRSGDYSKRVINASAERNNGYESIWDNGRKQVIISCIKLLRERGLIYEVSEALLWSCDPLLPAFLGVRIERNKKIINEIKQSGRGSASDSRLARLEVITDAYSAVRSMIEVII